MRQRTIAGVVSCTGIGLHSGAPSRLTLRPGEPGRGVVFARTDRGAGVEIHARPAAVRSTRLATSLGEGDASVGTVEHLLAALSGLGVDNVRAEVDGPELPGMDGSAAPFVYLLREAGLVEQSATRPVLRVVSPVEVREGARSIRVEPAPRLRISYVVDFDHPAIGRQQLELSDLEPASFARELAPARTFGFANDVRALRRAGLGRGASLANTVVLGDAAVLNPGGLRWPDEFVRHKALDLVGDLALLGVPLQGHVRVERGGHALHQRLVAALCASPRSWRLEGADADRLALALPQFAAAAGG